MKKFIISITAVAAVIIIALLSGIFHKSSSPVSNINTDTSKSNTHFSFGDIEIDFNIQSNTSDNGNSLSISKGGLVVKNYSIEIFEPATTNPFLTSPDGNTILFRGENSKDICETSGSLIAINTEDLTLRVVNVDSYFLELEKLGARTTAMKFPPSQIKSVEWVNNRDFSATYSVGIPDKCPLSQYYNTDIKTMDFKVTHYVSDFKY